MIDHQRETFGREPATLVEDGVTTHDGSVELLAGMCVPRVVEFQERTYVWQACVLGKHEYAEARVGGFEAGPMRCSARESGGARCGLPANHEGAHANWRPGPYTFDVDDFVEILTGSNAGELGTVSSIHPGNPVRFSVRNMAGERGSFTDGEIRLVAEEHAT
jgi:hypothetical protein